MLSFTARMPLDAEEPFVPNSYLLVTTGTFQKRPFLAPAERKAMLLESLDFNSYKWKWRIIAFVLLDNHYHLVLGHPPGDPSRLAHIVQSAHSYCAYHIRREDPSIRSRIWWNFWETPIPDQGQLLRLVNFVHENPRRHGVTDDPATYAQSSYSDYLQRDAATIRRREAEYPAADLDIQDNFD